MQGEEKVDFVTIKSEELAFGKNNFLEIAHKKAVSEKGENEFVSISRGFTNPAGMKRFKSSVSMPVDMAEKAAKLLGEIAKKG
jgi:hypothetical protein